MGLMKLIYGIYKDYMGLIRVVCWLYRDNGKENGNYFSII